MREQTLGEAIGLELERREKVVTFDEWWAKNGTASGAKIHKICAMQAWNHQQARIEALEKAAREYMRNATTTNIQAGKNLAALLQETNHEG